MSDGDHIPRSWVSCKLGDVFDYGTTSKAEPKDIPADAWVLELEDIEKDTSRIIQRSTFSDRQPKSTKNRFEAGDVLYGKLRPYLNKVVLADSPGFCSTEIVPISVPEGIDQSYLFFWLKHPTFQNYVTNVSHGLDMPRLGTKAGRAAPFLLAPTNEQRRISRKLTELVAQTTECYERLDRVPRILSQLRDSVLSAAISGQLTKEWRAQRTAEVSPVVLRELDPPPKVRRGVKPAAESPSKTELNWEYPDHWGKENAASLLMKGVLIDLKDGNHGTNHPRVDDFTPDGLPFITAAQVKDFRVDYDGAPKVSGAVLEKLNVGHSFPGDVVLTHKGTVGRVACISRDCMLTPQTTYYRANTDVLLPRYLMYYMSSSPFYKQLEAIKSQTTRDFVPISKQYSLWHIIPPLHEQEEIVRRVDEVFSQVDQIEGFLGTATKKVDRLIPEMLQKAYKGELVAQDPSDEPAVVLLEKIQSTSTGKGVGRKRRPRKPAKKRVRKKDLRMSKSRQDEDVYGMPYLADLLRSAGENKMTAKDLFRIADLPLADFYKQLAWEVENGHIRDDKNGLESI